MSLRWLAITGNSGAAKALRVAVGEQGFALVGSRSTFTLDIDQHDGPLTIDSVDSEFERLLVRQLRSCGCGELHIQDEGGVRSDAKVRILVPHDADSQYKVVNAVVRAFADEQVRWQRLAPGRKLLSQAPGKKEKAKAIVGALVPQLGGVGAGAAFVALVYMLTRLLTILLVLSGVAYAQQPITVRDSVTGAVVPTIGDTANESMRVTVVDDLSGGGPGGAVDTELADAAALADNFPNPTTAPAGAFVMVWDGSAWDRWTGAVTGTVAVSNLRTETSGSAISATTFHPIGGRSGQSGTAELLPIRSAADAPQRADTDPGVIVRPVNAIFDQSNVFNVLNESLSVQLRRYNATTAYITLYNDSSWNGTLTILAVDAASKNVDVEAWRVRDGARVTTLSCAITCTGNTAEGFIVATRGANIITVIASAYTSGSMTVGMAPWPDQGATYVANGSGTGAVNIQDGGNTITVDGTVTVGAFPDNEPFNVAQYGGVAVSATNPFHTKEIRSATPSLSNVNDTASSTTCLASNANRTGAIIVNDSTADLYLKFGSTASTTSYTYKLFTDGSVDIPFGYTGIIDCIWSADSTGAARVTELTQ